MACIDHHQVEHGNNLARLLPVKLCELGADVEKTIVVRLVAQGEKLRDRPRSRRWHATWFGKVQANERLCRPMAGRLNTYDQKCS